MPRTFRVEHTCGHVETHKLSMRNPETGEQREPTDEEWQTYTQRCMRRACNACLNHLPAGTHHYCLVDEPEQREPDFYVSIPVKEWK